jgi:hypothetical protein
MAKIVTSGSYEMSIGERVELSVAVTQSSATLTDFEWHLPREHILDDYIGPEYSFRRGEKVPVPDSALTGSAVSFCWANDGEYKVRVTYKMDGAKKEDSATFKVHRPVVSAFYGVTKGVAHTITVERGWCGMFGPLSEPSLLRGIIWTARVKRGSANPGRIGYIQLVKMLRIGPPKQPVDTGEYVLDGKAGKPCVFYWGWHGTEELKNKPVSLACTDTPGGRSEESVSLHFKDDFKLYLMYKSERPKSIWVPLGKMLWNWDAKFRRNNNTDRWTVDGTPSMSENPTGTFPINEFPEWTKYAPDFLGARTLEIA